MQPKNTSHITIKRVVVGILILVILISAATITIVILKNMTTNNSANTKPSASEIISSYSPKTIASLSDKSYKKQTGTLANIQYKLDSKSYSVSATTNQTVIFFASSLSQKDNTAEIQNQTIDFMKQKNLDKISAYSSTDKMIQYINFANSTAVCQLTDYYPATNSNIYQSHELACEDVSSISQEYALVDKLLLIYKQTQKLPDFTEAVRDYGTEGNVSYSVLNVSSSTNRLKLLFVAVDNQWSYIGDITIVGNKYTSSKYNVTPEIKAKISDPKYKGFLLKNIQ